MLTPSAELSSSFPIMRNKAFKLFCYARVFTALAYQMLTIAIGWQMYALTGSTFYLGLVGLMQFLPMIALTLIAGHAVDSYDRRLIIRMCQFTASAGILILAVGSYTNWLSKENILLIAFLVGAARAFEGPAMQALLPGLVDAPAFPQAVALASSSLQTATIIGPALGGLLYAHSPTLVFSLASLLFLISSLLISLIQVDLAPQTREPVTLKSLCAGITFIRSKPAVLGAISLDLFAVLLGGATALLPVYAREILAIGPAGMGILRAAPAAGALLMSVFLAHHPLRKRVGRTMFMAVIVFGLATIVFAVSTSFILSLAALFVLGAADLISVVIRSSLVQLQTPDEMRGRVSAINSMFIGTSNQLGEFESGLTAAWFGVVPSVLLGGTGTILVAVIWMRAFAALARIETLQNEGDNPAGNI
ncbi:MAG TPA: MFS transporter, partial [Firmicutes bacterium]|nr:MFS transporter [Bacillota bacterium]